MTASLGSYLDLEPFGSLTTLIHHLTRTPVHPAYFPYLRFPVIHAVRIAIVWASLTRARNDGRQGNGPSRVGVGVLGDLFGYLCLACTSRTLPHRCLWAGELANRGVGGGSTFVALLQSTPPPWLLSITPWLIYPLVHLLVVQTGVARVVGRIPLIDLLGAYVDGLTRGTTLAAISSSSFGPGGRALLSIVGTCGGGWAVQSLSMHQAQWAITTPAVLQRGQGILGTMDVWAPALCSIVFSFLTTPSLSTSTSIFGFDFGLSLDGKPTTVDTATARSVVVALMASLLAARVITRYVLSSRPDRGGKVSAERAARELLEMDEKPNTSGNGTSTPKKKSGRKGNSNSSSIRAATPQR